MADYAQQLLEIQNKIFQVLRIKKQLESRRQEYLRIISSLTDRNQITIYLNYLENTYKREERVYSICEKGLANALSILGEAKESVAKTQSFGERIKNNFLGKVPVLGKKYKGTQSLIPLLNIMYTRLKEQIIFFEANFVSLRGNIVEQHGHLLKAMADFNKGDSKDAAIDYAVISRLRSQELEIFRIIGKKSKSSVSRLVTAMNRIQIALSQSERFQRNKGLLSLQAKFQAFPLVNPATILVSLTLGPQFAPLAYGLLTFVKYAPIVAILLKEGTVSIKNQINRPRSPIPLSIRPAYA